MRTPPFSLSVCLVAMLLQSFPALISSSPVQLPSRSPVCSNAHTTVVGTLLDRRDLLPHGIPSLRPRTVQHSTVWRVDGTRTYLQIHITAILASNAVIPVLSDAYNSVYAHLYSLGDGPVAGGAFKFTVNQMVVHIWNANNHQVTWGVLGSTLWGLRKYMETAEVWGNAAFHVYDGSNLVGDGILGSAPGG